MTLLASWVDGRDAASIAVADRAVHFGDGVFETIAAVAGRPRFLDAHLARLARGLAALAIDPPDAGDLAAEIRRAAAAAPAAVIKVIVSRGVAQDRGYGYRGDERTTRIVLAYDWPDAGHDRAAGRVARSAIMAGEQPKLAGIKHLNRLENVLARREASHRSLDEVLLCRADGSVSGGSMTNVFLVRAGALETPRVDRSGVAGVLRAGVLAAAARIGMPAVEAEIAYSALAGADEVFLTNALVGIWTVAEIDGRRLPEPVWARRLWAEISADAARRLPHA